MSRIDWDRWAPLTGIVFVALVVVTFFLPAASPPTLDDPASDVVAWFEEHETALLANGYISGLALVFLVWFLASLYRRLRDGGEARLGVVALGGGLVLATFALIAVSLQQYLAWGLATDLDEETVRVLWVLWAGGLGWGFPLAILAGATALSAFKSGVFPLWYGAVGAIAALWFLVGSAAYASSGFFSPTGAFQWIGFLVFLVWVLVTSVLMLMRQEAEQPAAHAAPVT
ncbi:MAG TPA: hypothetical protein VI540_01830 [Gaiellaceae bacterium]|nr:hypothetical protein [Gaiellaceae bacterium]